MKSKESAAGYLRICQLMVGMIDAVEDGDKERLVKLSRHLTEDTEDFVGVLLEIAGVSDDDLDKLSPPDDEELLKDAASADTIKTAVVN